MLHEPKSYTANCITTHSAHTQAALLMPGNNKLFNTSLKLPARPRNCGAQLTILLSAAQTCAPMQWEKKLKRYICVTLFNQRFVTNASSCLSWFLSPLSLWVIFMPCVSLTLAGSCWDFFNVTHWCVQSCGDGPNPFWEVLTLNTKAWDCLLSATPTFYYNSIDIDPETGSLQSFYFTILCECMCVDLCCS